MNDGWGYSRTPSTWWCKRIHVQLKKRKLSFFFLRSGLSFVCCVYVQEKEFQQHKQMNIHALGFFFLFMEGRQPFRSENRFPIDFPMCRLPTYTYICNWASVTWKEKQDFKRSSGVFSYWRRTGHGSHHFQGHMYTDTRMHMKRRERAWNSFLAFIVGCRQPTLAQSDTRR